MSGAMAGQASMFDPDTWSGKTCQEPSPAAAQKEQTSKPSSKKSSGSSAKKPPLFLSLRRDGLTPDAYPVWETAESPSPWHGAYTTHSFGESPSVAVESRLSQILEDSPHPKYCLSAKACQGILNRAARRGKELPPELKAALESQAQLPQPTEEIGTEMPEPTTEGTSSLMAFAQNTRDEVRDLHDVAGCLAAEAGMKQQTYVAGFTNRGYASGDVAETMRFDPHGAYPMVAGFKSGQGAQARSIGYQEEVAPTLPSEAGGNSVPAIVRTDEEFDWL